ncbi:MAG: hypothetical protein B9S34_16705 [Opitutia bacterium Tous-C1TDCM]|nr:MAG: hypothetical protein B9S34_16705 [Opitutae bacterium Tous-C1TDCM]
MISSCMIRITTATPLFFQKSDFVFWKSAGRATWIARKYNTAPSGVNLTSQPWFGNASIANDFAALVGGSLGFGNFNSQSPYFVYSLGNGGTSWTGAYYHQWGYVSSLGAATEGWMGRFAYVVESTPVAAPDSGTSLGLGLIAFVVLGLAKRRLKPAAA